MQLLISSIEQMLKRRPLISTLGSSEELHSRHEDDLRVWDALANASFEVARFLPARLRLLLPLLELPWLYFSAVTCAVHVAEFQPA